MQRLVSCFQNSLRKRPLLTNTVVYATFYSAAEISHQIHAKHFTDHKPDIDWASAGRIIAVGSCLSAPTLFFWYRFLDRKLPGTTPKCVIKKVLIDQYTMTPVLLATFYTMIGILEGKEDVFADLKKKYWSTFKASQMFWLPIQTINFLLVPPHLRVVYVSSASFIWINVLCSFVHL